MYEPAFIDNGSKCHRVLECETCYYIENRDIVGGTNIGFISWNIFVFKSHPFRPRIDAGLLEKVEQRLIELCVEPRSFPCLSTSFAD